MVWEQEASLVIMLTTTVERGRVSWTFLSLLFSFYLESESDAILLQPLLTVREINVVYLGQIKLTLVLNFCFIIFR